MPAITSAQWKMDCAAKRSSVIKISHGDSERKCVTLSSESGRRLRRQPSQSPPARNDRQGDKTNYVDGYMWMQRTGRDCRHVGAGGKLSVWRRVVRSLRDGWKTDLQVNRRRRSRQVSGWLDEQERPTADQTASQRRSMHHYCIRKRKTSSHCDIWGGLGESWLLVGSHVQPWVNYSH